MQPFLGIVILLVGLMGLLATFIKDSFPNYVVGFDWLKNILYAGIVAFLLASIWMPLGVTKTVLTNFIFVGTIITVLISFFYLVVHFYENILRFLLRFKFLFLAAVRL